MAEGTGSPNPDGWTLGKAVESADGWLRGLGAPRQQKPAGLGEEYSFPTTIVGLTSEQVGTLALKLGAWSTYLIGVLGNEQAELDAFQTLYDIKLGAAMRALNEEVSPKKRIVNDELRPMAINANQDLKRLTENLINRQLRVKKLEIQVKIFQDQRATLSREQARRAEDSGPRMLR